MTRPTARNTFTGALERATHPARSGALLLAPCLALLLSATLLAQAPGDAPDLARGLELYARHCAACHGSTGDGNGAAAHLLDPKPRNFTSGSFRVISTSDGNPSDEDLLGTLRRGMPGSSMPPWGHLPDADLRALVTAVRQLTIEGIVANDLADDEDLTREEALFDALDDYLPGDLAAVPTRPADAFIDLARGADLYAASCASCHGVEGRADVAVDIFDSEGWPVGARDFTQGIFKGGSRGIDIARRIWLGMPGSPMPSLPLAQNDLWSLVAHVENMIDRDVEPRLAQSRRTLSAARVDSPLNSDPNAEVWSRATSTWLALMPLWWRVDRPEGVEFSALHDGEQLAVRLSWSDTTRDVLVLDQQAFSDGAAVQLSPERDPPFFGMGDSAQAVTFWHWQASRQRDVDDGVPSLTALHPNAPRGALAEQGAPQDAGFNTARAVHNPVAPGDDPRSVATLSARGQGTLTQAPDDAQRANGRGLWTAPASDSPGRWSLVFLQPLDAANASAGALRPGAEISIAFAVWDGSAGDRNGTKSVSIWHALSLED